MPSAKTDRMQERSPEPSTPSNGPLLSPIHVDPFGAWEIALGWVSHERSMRALAAIVICTFGFLARATAEPATPIELQCEFGYSALAIATPDTRYFAAEMKRATEDDFVTFYNINPITRSAQVSGRRIDSDMVVFAARSTNWTFTEFTNRGDTYVTQVFYEAEPGAEKGVYRVVRSKQWTEFGSVIGTQFYGVCLAVY